MYTKTKSFLLFLAVFTIVAKMAKTYPVVDNGLYRFLPEVDDFVLDKRFKWKCNGWFKYRCGKSKAVHRDIRNIE